MNGKLRSFGMRLLVSLCFFGQALYAQRLQHAMFNFTSVHYEGLGESKFELFPIQGGLEFLYRGSLALSVLGLLLALNVFVNAQKLFRSTGQSKASSPSTP